MYYLTPLRNNFRFIRSFGRDSIYKEMIQILGRATDDTGYHEMFNVTISHNDVSIILPEPVFEEHYSHLNNDGIVYKCLEVTNAAIDEIGVLESVTSLFASVNIPVLCVSAFIRNYILFPLEYSFQIENMVKNHHQLQFHNVELLYF